MKPGPRTPAITAAAARTVSCGNKSDIIACGHALPGKYYSLSVAGVLSVAEKNPSFPMSVSTLATMFFLRSLTT